MIAVYVYENKVIRYTDVALVREQLDRKHVVKLRNGKFITPAPGWVEHHIKLERGKS